MKEVTALGSTLALSTGAGDQRSTFAQVFKAIALANVER
jgi:hypothetical protein